MTPESLRTQRFCGSPQSLRFVFLRLVVQPRNFLPQVRKTPSQLSPATQLTPFPPGAPNEDPATAWPEHGLGHDSIHWLKDTPTNPPRQLWEGGLLKRTLGIALSFSSVPENSSEWVVPATVSSARSFPSPFFTLTQCWAPCRTWQRTYPQGSLGG